MSACADWIEHALATGGEAYLRTPEQDLPLFVLWSLDVWAIFLVSAALVIYIFSKLTQLIAHALSRSLENGAAKKAA